MVLHRRSITFFYALVLLFPLIATAQQFSPDLYREMRWRMVGPTRGGRTRAGCGVPQQPNVFYIGAVNGGVWKTTDFGHTWQPIFDDQPTGSIGAIAVAPSDPNVIYVGSGEGLQRPDLSTGDGMYKSTDGGKTWTHLGLRDGQQIPQIAVHPRNPDFLFVAVLGHPYGPNKQRGIYRSTDGGKTFEQVLYRDENTGGSDVQIDPSNPQIVFAGMWEARQGPWENGAWAGTNGGLFKSADGGSTWRQLTNGLPEGVVQADVTISPTNPNRVYATVATQRQVGFYRSDDGGESWTKTTDDPRPVARIGGGDLPVPKVDPKNPDVVYSVTVVVWKSTDAGKTWTGIRGAPGGDDYQNMWINPNDPKIMLVPSDQGAVITVNGGETWSTWYNQPTAQLYHVAADNAFPYRLCSGQQDSGSVCISSRGNDGEITMREWHPVGVEEYGYAAPDPTDPDIIYGGKLTRYDRRTGQIQNILPAPLRGRDFRVLRTEPVIFSPSDPHTMYFAANTLWKTRDSGHSWQQISPDLTRKTWDVPANVGKYRDQQTAQPTQRGVIYAVAPSPLNANLIWAGTDDGLIHVTSNGGRDWRNVTPKQLVPWAKVSILEASHFDAQTAYAAINTIRLDDPRPHILRTRDGGKNWTEIVSGIPGNENVDVVREDPQRRGLLFAGTERSVYVSFDDGDHWQSLKLNLPPSSVRDLIVKNDDLVVATHGRGFWILDDITPLRQLNQTVADAMAFLFKPQNAIRVRWNMNPDTPMPPDTPAGENPPDGAIVNYVLKSNASGPVTLEILDSAGKLVRRYSSSDPVHPTDPMLGVPKYWARPPRVLSASAGMHRWIWDMHLPPLPQRRQELPMQAVFRDTPPAPTSPWAMPGQYTVRLTVDGKSYTQPLNITMDPRVKTPLADLQQQFAVSEQLYEDAATLSTAVNELVGIREQLRAAKAKAGQGAAAEAVDAFSKKLDEVGGPEQQGFGGGRFGAQGADTLNSVRGSLMLLMSMIQEADAAPTVPQVNATADRHNAIAPLMARWNQVKSQDLQTLNSQLQAAGVPEIKLESVSGGGSQQ